MPPKASTISVCSAICSQETLHGLVTVLVAAEDMRQDHEEAPEL
jgi:hypothetical protein